MKLELQVSENAYDDQLEIWVYIARDNVSAADRLLDKIEKSYRLLTEFPNMGQKRDDLGAGLRTLPVGKYLIVYEANPDALRAKRIVHGARDLRSALEDED